MLKTSLFTALSVIALLSGCASSTQTYGADGRITHSINCSGTARNWGMCEEKAGELCGSKGYEIVSRSSDTGAMASGGGGNFYASTLQNRTMMVACR